MSSSHIYYVSILIKSALQFIFKEVLKYSLCLSILKGRLSWQIAGSLIKKDLR